MHQSNTIIIIAGPTAVGKTAFAIQLAMLLDTAIISADSRQCYRELNIGVAKPSPAELQQVPHYFINSHSVKEEVNAVVFEQYALQKAAEIFHTKNVAIMVGGTGLYIKAFTQGLDDIPPVDDDIRNAIIHQFNTNGLEWLQQQVQENDPAFWQVTEQQNPQRLMRGLEVKLSTGKSIIAFRSGNKQQRPFNIVSIGLELPREVLYQRINQRVDRMMDAGLVAEVQQLQMFKSLNALQTVGYTEIFDYLDGNTSLDTAVEQIKRNTRHYAKRQLTWFKKDNSMTWYSPADDPGKVLQQLYPQ